MPYPALIQLMSMATAQKDLAPVEHGAATNGFGALLTRLFQKSDDKKPAPAAAPPAAANDPAPGQLKAEPRAAPHPVHPRAAAKAAPREAEPDVPAPPGQDTPLIVLPALQGAAPAQTAHTAPPPPVLVPSSAPEKSVSAGTRTWDGVPRKPEATARTETVQTKDPVPVTASETVAKTDVPAASPREATELMAVTAGSHPPRDASPVPPIVVQTADQPAPSKSAPAPADQIASALVNVASAADGTQTVTIRLRPAELGQVQIRVDQTPEGAARVAITADRPETLQLLQRDQPRLMQALDQAGIAPEGRTMSFQVSQPEQVGATASRPDSMATGSGDSGQNQNSGARRESGETPRDPGSGAEQGQGQWQSRARWFRAGLDITA